MRTSTASTVTEARRADRGTRRRMALAVAFGAAAILAQVLVHGDGSFIALYVEIPVAMAVLGLGIRRTRVPGVAMWWGAVAGLGLVGAGTFALFRVTPYLADTPSWYLLPGLIWIGSYVCFTCTEAGVVLMQWRRHYDRAMVLDAAVVFVAVMVPVIELLARPAFSIAEGPLVFRSMNAAYVLFDGLLVVLAAQLILTGDRSNPGLWWFVSAGAVVVLGDLAVILFGAGVDIRYLAGGWIASHTLLMVMSLHPRFGEVTQPRHAFNSRLDRPRATILGLSLMTVPITVVLAQAGGNTIAMPFLLLAAGVVAALVLVRLTWLFQDRETAQQAVETRERYFRALVRNIGDVISVVDTDGVARYRSPSALRLFQQREADGGARDGFDFIHPDDRSIAESLFAEALEAPRRVVRGQLRGLGRSGDVVWLEVSLQNLLDDRDVGNIVVTCHDVTARHTLEDELRHQAFHDALTGLPNRKLALDRLDRLVARASRSGTRVGVAFIDVDNFKTINDTLGHRAGDELLRAVSERLTLAVRPQDTVARLGGDEFLVLLELGDSAESEDLARRIVEGFAHPFVLEGREVSVTVSLGMAASTDVDGGTLLRNADVALYRAKAAGRNGYAVYRADMDTDDDRLELFTDLRRALQNGDELRVHFQPFVRLDDGSLCGVEALVRWEHPRRGLLLPDTFIPLAEENGLIVPLGRWVLDEACRQIASLAPDDVELSVNLSSRQLDDEGLVDDIKAALASSGLPAGRLTLELTESVLLADGPPVARLGELTAIGVHVAVDDFGTGYSSLAYLRNLPVDTLKVDRQFISTISDDEDAATLVVGVLDLARAMGMRTVAEGVEQQEQAAVLRRGGCDLAQGYLFARPAPLAEVAALLGWTTTALVD